MINTHKELIDGVSAFVSSNDYINEFVYLKDVDKISDEVQNSEPRVLVLGLDSMNFTEEDYNMDLEYKFILADMTMYDTGAVINSETENLYAISALADYISFSLGTPAVFGESTFNIESDIDSCYTSISGSFAFTVKRTPAQMS